MSKKYNICDEPGPCWKGYIYIGPKPKTKKSCIKKEKLCNLTQGHGIECKSKIKCNIDKNTNDINTTDYKKCLIESKKRFDKNTLTLCPEGYCSAKYSFDVYPSAYANAYASSVCQGKKKDLLGNTSKHKEYINKLEKRKSNKNPLQRWFNEKWVNICEKGNGPGGYKDCGTGEGIYNIDKYPYCRPYYKLPGTTVITVPELSSNKIKEMCIKKRSIPQGINGKPSRVYIKGGNNTNLLTIPYNVKENAKLGLSLKRKGFDGATTTGINRGKQLAYNIEIDIKSLADMRTWFSRHGPDASNGGTCYRGYCKWLKHDKPMDKNKNMYRGAIAWLLWGGDDAYLWLKEKNIRLLLKNNFPNRKESKITTYLGC